MTRLRCISALLLVMFTVGGCGEGYVSNPARLNVTDVTDGIRAEALVYVTRILKAEGFDDLGKYQGMIDLLHQSPLPEKEQARQLARLNRERTFLKKSSGLTVVWADYSKEAPDKIDVAYQPPSAHFIELRIYESRPGGFGPTGLDFYGRFLSALRDKYGSAVIVINEPPPTDDAEYRRVTTKNRIGAIIGASIALLIPFALTGPLSFYCLKKLRASNSLRRLLFVLINTWLIAPMPFPGGFIFVFPGPNLLAFPWTNMEYYRQFASTAAVTFPCTLTFCTGVSLFLFRPRTESP